MELPGRPRAQSPLPRVWDEIQAGGRLMPGGAVPAADLLLARGLLLGAGARPFSLGGRRLLWPLQARQLGRCGRGGAELGEDLTP